MEQNTFRKNNQDSGTAAVPERTQTRTAALELYLHIPFCARKCRYCDFLSAPAESGTIAAYISRLISEIRYYKEAYQNERVTSVYIGGGTPSLLHPDQIARLMEAVYDSFAVDGGAEISMECNPGTLTSGKAAAMYRSGINRVSLGLQSADNRELALLGRIHTWEEFTQSLGIIRDAGFENINVDLMSALPGQTEATWRETLCKVLDQKVPHISAYSLIIEEGTPFYDLYREDDLQRQKGEIPRLLPSEEAERRMYEDTKTILSEAGYDRYEISNYAKPGYECIHNTGYWTGVSYLGLGLGSSSLIGHTRFHNTDNMTAYLNDPFSHLDIHRLTEEEQMEEFLFLGLRMMRGVSTAEFFRRFGRPIETVYQNALEKLSGQELIVRKDGRIWLTARGIDVSNQVFSEFLF